MLYIWVTKSRYRQCCFWRHKQIPCDRSFSALCISDWLLQPKNSQLSPTRHRYIRHSYVTGKTYMSCFQVTLLENKKSFQVNIFLRQFRIPTSAVIENLATGNSEPLGAEKLRGLRNLLPDTEEVSVATRKKLPTINYDKSECICYQRLWRVRISVVLECWFFTSSLSSHSNVS